MRKEFVFLCLTSLSFFIFIVNVYVFNLCFFLSAPDTGFPNCESSLSRGPCRGSLIRYLISLRISNKYGSITWNNDPTKQLRLRRRGFQPSPAHHWSEIFLEIRHQLHTSILLSNWILTNQQTSIWNLRSAAYFEYTCYFKVVTLFVKKLFRVRLPYLLLIRRFKNF
jgi:hypothetical protein